MSNEVPVTAEVKAPGGQRRREKRDVHGWVVLDKPVGMTSTHAVSILKRLFKARRAGKLDNVADEPQDTLEL